MKASATSNRGCDAAVRQPRAGDRGVRRARQPRQGRGVRGARRRDRARRARGRALPGRLQRALVLELPLQRRRVQPRPPPSARSSARCARRSTTSTSATTTCVSGWRARARRATGGDDRRPPAGRRAQPVRQRGRRPGAASSRARTTGRAEIVSTLGGYHGVTGFALAASDPRWREPFGAGAARLRARAVQRPRSDRTPRSARDRGRAPRVDPRDARLPAAGPGLPARRSAELRARARRAAGPRRGADRASVARAPTGTTSRRASSPTC